jgi:hypothetical protein
MEVVAVGTSLRRATAVTLAVGLGKRTSKGLTTGAL